MAMACKNCRAELSGKYPTHLVQGSVYCDLCFDLLWTILSSVYLLRAHNEFVREKIRRRARLFGD